MSLSQVTLVSLEELVSEERYWTEKSRQKNNNFVSHFCIFQAAICS
ncbi:hypothetical protein [Candidatus Tisiphia endosymbiont of Sialis lutaria]